MRTRLTFVAAMHLLIALTAQAQEFPRWEGFGGYSYANINLGPQAGLFSPGARNYNGFDLAFSFNPNRNIRLLADVGFQFGKTTAIPPPMFTKIHLQSTEALLGPQFTLRKRRATLFANTLAGVTNTRLQGQSGTFYEDLLRRNDLTLAFGGGLDVNVTRMIAIRAFQAEYLPVRRGGSWETTYTLNAGVVLRFGFH